MVKLVIRDSIAPLWRHRNEGNTLAADLNKYSEDGIQRSQILISIHGHIR